MASIQSHFCTQGNFQTKNTSAFQAVDGLDLSKQKNTNALQAPPTQDHQHWPHVAGQLRWTLRLRHLFLRAFLAHFLLAHWPGESWQGCCASEHVHVPLSQLAVDPP